MPLLRNGDAWPDVIPYPLPAAIGLNAAEHVEASLEPVGKSLRDLKRLVHGVVSGLDTVNHLLTPVHCEVGMDFDHGRARRD